MTSSDEILIPSKEEHMATFIPAPVEVLLRHPNQRPQRICVWRRFEQDFFEKMGTFPNCSQHEHVSEEVAREIADLDLYSKTLPGGKTYHRTEASWLIGFHYYHSLRDSHPRYRREYEKQRELYGDLSSIIVMNEVTEMVIGKSAGYDVHMLARY